MTTITLYAAPWCGPCSNQKDLFDSEGIDYDYVDIDEDREIAQDLGIKSVPTIIVRDSDGEVERHVGFTEAEKFE